MAPKFNDTSRDTQSWLQFAIRLASVITLLVAGWAALYARLCLVEYKVDALGERLTDLEDGRYKKVSIDERIADRAR